MDTPLGSPSVPDGKRKHLDYPSPSKDQLLANLLFDFPTSDFPPILKPILEILIDTRDELHALKDVCSRISQENEKLRAENIRKSNCWMHVMFSLIRMFLLLLLLLQYNLNCRLSISHIAMNKSWSVRA